MGTDGKNAGGVLVRRNPEDSVLHQIVDEHLPGFLSRMEEGGYRFPRFALRELEAFARCGDLRHGFARIYCESCRKEELLAFSCKGRGFCPSCCARRMTSQAAHLVDHVLPDVPIRQWVLTLPFDLRGFFAFDAEAQSEMRRIYSQELLGSFAARAEDSLLVRPQGGAVHFTHRYDSALRVNLHFHSIVLDGVYDDSERPLFLELPRPTPELLESILLRIVQRLRRYLEKRGLVPGEGHDAEPIADDDEQSLALAQSAGVRGESSLGPRAADWVQRLGRDPDASFEAQHESRSVRIAGFSLYAGPRIDPCAAEHRERLIRYVCRPPIAEGRLSVMQDGYILYKLKRPFQGGTHSVRLHPFAFLERLCTLVPRPRQHQLTYAGVLAPASPRRRAIIPAPTPRRRRPTIPPKCAKSAREQTSEGEKAPRKKPRSRARTNPYIRWSELLRRSFGIDIFTCPHCNGRRRILAFLDDPVVVHKILDHLGLPKEPRAPPIPQLAELF